MKKLLIFLGVIAFIGIFFNTPIQAEHWAKSDDPNLPEVAIPQTEFASYFDSNGIYTVVGAVKNGKTSAVIPTVTINIEDEKKLISESFEFSPVLPSKDLPFKIKFPEVISNPTLLAPEISYVVTKKAPLNVEVIYDKTLIKHEDNHQTGRIINNGNQTVYNIKVFALAHGPNHDVLDVAQNMELIEKIEPGEIREFSMYPDPSVISEVYYYSCFAVTDSFVRPMSTERNDNKFYFRYDSGSWYTSPEFNEKGTELHLRTLNSFPLETYANFEFPRFSDNEKFSVFLNGEEKHSIQSIGETGNWHVAFNVAPREGGEIVIKGFKEGWEPGNRIFVPDWIKVNALWWYEGQVNEEPFVRGIEFMLKENIVKVATNEEIQKEKIKVPQWLKNNAGWWAQEKIPDETFVKGLEFLIKNGIIQI